ncbi:S-adenosyl-L-methionine-dependent methyltransferase [Pterulicium gracile]|uniref:S-adenosyl-L-methionine-dependent methyltransferase n=1 Tax=Pterulicium gracile TaxID=1884261 RepID=A0A5C3QZ54_9AGAR|nr:S-adenosyl-L-methionine-dependent methyltransferase [Pterula gracilis]
MSVHATAQTGFGSGTNDHYDRSRPSYPSESLAHIRSNAPSREKLNIAELGAGTGLFTRALLADPSWAQSVGTLKAVEPSQGMRDTFNAKTEDDRVSIQDGTFQQTNLPDGWADMVIIAQAWHWAHPNYDAGSAELARILKPDGVAVFIWNLEDKDGAAWVDQIRNVYEQYEDGTPQFRLGLWRQTFETKSYQALFAPQKEHEHAYTLSANLDVVLNRALSKSYVAIRPDDVKSTIKEELTKIIQRGDGQVKSKENPAEFEFPYKTLAIVAKKK